jgi:hypothetical protein
VNGIEPKTTMNLESRSSPRAVRNGGAHNGPEATSGYGENSAGQKMRRDSKEEIELRHLDWETNRKYSARGLSSSGGDTKKNRGSGGKPTLISAHKNTTRSAQI